MNEQFDLVRDVYALIVNFAVNYSFQLIESNHIPIPFPQREIRMLPQ